MERRTSPRQREDFDEVKAEPLSGLEEEREEERRSLVGPELSFVITKCQIITIKMFLKINCTQYSFVMLLR